MFELILISQLHPYEKIQREKRQNTDWILQQLLERKKKKRNSKQQKEKKKDTCSWIFEKYQDYKFYRSGILWAESPFEAAPSIITFISEYFLNVFFPPVRMKRSEYIYTTLTLHKYGNNNYCT